MRYKVVHEKVCVAGFETAQGAGDYLFTIPAEKISEFYIHDTKENTAFPYCTYQYEWGEFSWDTSHDIQRRFKNTETGEITNALRSQHESPARM